MFCDSDDMLKASTVEKLYALAEENTKTVYCFIFSLSEEIEGVGIVKVHVSIIILQLKYCSQTKVWVLPYNNSDYITYCLLIFFIEVCSL